MEQKTKEQKWENNLNNLKSGTFGDPTSATALLRYWESQERDNYPCARDNVEYFRRLVRDELLDLMHEGEYIDLER